MRMGIEIMFACYKNHGSYRWADALIWNLPFPFSLRAAVPSSAPFFDDDTAVLPDGAQGSETASIASRTNSGTVPLPPVIPGALPPVIPGALPPVIPGTLPPVIPGALPGPAGEAGGGSGR